MTEINHGTVCKFCNGVYIKPCGGLDHTCPNRLYIEAKAKAKAEAK